MPGQSKVNGVWRTTTGLSVKVSGSWKTATGAFIKVGGQWKQWFASKIQDAFNRASTVSGLGTAESGQLWSSLRGNWRISGSNQAISDDAGSTYALAAINMGAPDVNVTMDVSNGVGAAFWVTDSGSWWSSYTRHTTSPSSYQACNGGYSTCGGSGCNPGNCCSGIGTTTDFICNGGGASCSGSGCQPSGCCSGVSYSGGGTYCSDYRTGQSSSSGCIGGCTNTPTGGGTSCSGYGTFSSTAGCVSACGTPTTNPGTFTCNSGYAESQGTYPSGCCGGYGTYSEVRVTGSTCNYNISECVGYNCTPSGCCPGEAYILKNYYTGGKYYTDCYSGVTTTFATVTLYYCYTTGTTGAATYSCYTSQVNNPIVDSWSGCWGYSTSPITGSCYTSYNQYITRSCYTSYNTVNTTTYTSDLVIVSSVSGTVNSETTVNISTNTSGFTQVGSIFVSTLGNAVTAKAYSGSAQSGELATATVNPSNPTKGTSVGILKAPSTGSQGSTADTFLATLNI